MCRHPLKVCPTIHPIRAHSYRPYPPALCWPLPVLSYSNRPSHALARSVAAGGHYCRGSRYDAILWVDFRFGVPTRITTDQGRQFESQLFHALGILTGSHRSRTTSYHPFANGLVERMHRQLITALTCHTGSSWLDALPVVLHGIRNAFKPDPQATAAEMVYGETLRLPGGLLTAPSRPNLPPDAASFVHRLREAMQNLHPATTVHHGAPSVFVFKAFNHCSHVFLRNDTVRAPLQQPYLGPYGVLVRDGKIFTLSVNGKEMRVSMDRFKPAYMLTDDVPPAPLAPSFNSCCRPVADRPGLGCRCRHPA